MKRAVEPFGNEVVRLRPIGEADLDSTLAWRNRDEARKWFKTSTLIEPEQHRAWFARYYLRDDDFVFVVEADGRRVGQAAVYGIDWTTHEAEVGRFLAAPACEGRGFIGNACVMLLRFCASTLGLRYVFLEVMETNERAIRVYRRCGFVEEARDSGLVRMGCELAAPAAGASA